MVYLNDCSHCSKECFFKLCFAKFYDFTVLCGSFLLSHYVLVALFQLYPYSLILRDQLPAVFSISLIIT